MSLFRSDSASSRLIAGDTWTFRVDAGAALPADGWAATAYLTGPQPLSAPAVGDGAVWGVTFSAAATAGLTAGPYVWTLSATRAGERVTVATGRVVVVDNPATAGGDTRTHAEKMLAAIEAVLEGRITADVESYQIAGRQLVKIPVTELRSLRAMYAAEVSAARRGGAIGGVEVVFRSPYV